MYNTSWWCTLCFRRTATGTVGFLNFLPINFKSQHVHSGGLSGDGSIREVLEVQSHLDSQPLKRKCCHFDEILITDCTESCHFDNFRCSQWWKFRQNDDISVSVTWKILSTHGFHTAEGTPVHRIAVHITASGKWRDHGLRWISRERISSRRWPNYGR